MGCPNYLLGWRSRSCGPAGWLALVPIKTGYVEDHTPPLVRVKGVGRQQQQSLTSQIDHDNNMLN